MDEASRSSSIVPPIRPASPIEASPSADPRPLEDRGSCNGRSPNDRLRSARNGDRYGLNSPFDLFRGWSYVPFVDETRGRAFLPRARSRAVSVRRACVRGFWPFAVRYLTVLGGGLCARA